jgi:hypothetical protein
MRTLQRPGFYIFYLNVAIILLLSLYITIKTENWTLGAFGFASLIQCILYVKDQSSYALSFSIMAVFFNFIIIGFYASSASDVSHAAVKKDLLFGVALSLAAYNCSLIFTPFVYKLSKNLFKCDPNIELLISGWMADNLNSTFLELNVSDTGHLSINPEDYKDRDQINILKKLISRQNFGHSWPKEWFFKIGTPYHRIHTNAHSAHDIIKYCKLLQRYPAWKQKS